MTNLLLLYPDIPRAAKCYVTNTSTASESPNEDEFNLHRNTLSGERYTNWLTSYESDLHNAYYDLGNDGTSDITKSVNFLCLARLDYKLAYAQANGLNVSLSYSDDGSSYSAAISNTSISGLTLIGNHSNDYVFLITDTDAHRYWRVRFSTSSGPDFAMKLSKIYFGSYFDMGRDPRFKINKITTGDSIFTTSGGITYQGRVRTPYYEIDLKWEGVTDAALQSFVANIVKYKYSTPIFLYARSFTNILDGHSLIHCKLMEFETEQLKADWNNITCKFYEVIG